MGAMATTLRKLVLFSVLAVPAFGACPAGLQQITDSFLTPDGAPWVGAITYKLASNTTAAGATYVGATQNINVTNGLSLCLVPGLYTPVTLRQSGSQTATTTQWGVKDTGAPFSYADINGVVVLNGATGATGAQGNPGIAGPAGATGATGPAGGLTGTASGALTGTYPSPQFAYANYAQAQGARGDLVSLNSGCGITATAQDLICSGASFVPGDVGKGITVKQANSSTHNLYTTIASYVSATHVTLTTPAGATVSNVSAFYGTDNRSAFINTVALNQSWNIPPGTYYLSGPVPVTYPELISGGSQSTIIYCAYDTSAAAFTLDWISPTSIDGWQTGLSNMIFIGPGVLAGPTSAGTSTAIQLGGSNGSIGAKLTNVTVSFFNTGLKLTANSYYNIIEGSFFKYNRTALIMPQSSVNNEGIKFLNTQFQSGGTDWGQTDISDCVVLDTSAFLITFDTLSAVDCQIHFTNNAFGTFTFNSVHMEEPTGSSTQPMVLISGGYPSVVWYAPNVNVGHVNGTGPAEWASIGSGALVVHDGQFFNYETGSPPVLATLTTGGAEQFYNTKDVYLQGFADFITNAAVGNGPSYVEPNATIPRITTPYQVHQDDKYVQCNGGTAAVTLPANNFASEEIIVQNLSASQACVVTGNSGNIGGSPTYSVPASSSLYVVWRNDGWNIVSTGGGGGAVSSVFSRSGAVTAQSGDYAVGQVTGAAPTASPTFTGPVTLGSDITASLAWAANSRLLSLSDGRLHLLKNNISTGVQLDFGTDGLLQVLNRNNTPGSFRSGTYQGVLNTVASSATPAFDLSLGAVQYIAALATNATATVSNIVAGTWSTFLICRSAGTETLSMPGSVHNWVGLSGGAGACTSQQFYAVDGSNLYGETTSSGGGSVSSVFTRTGAVTASSGDYTVSQVTGAAPLASPTFTGTVTLPAATVVNGVTLTTGGSSTAFLNGAGSYTTPTASVNILGVVRSSSTQLTIGTGCAPTTPCNVSVNGVVTQITSSATATISGSGTGAAYIYVTAAGALTVGHNLTVSCSGCTQTPGITDFPDDAVKLWVWSATTGTWDLVNAALGDVRAPFSSDPLTAGTGIAITKVGSATTISQSTLLSCDISVGDQSGSAITNSQLGPQAHVCKIPSASMVVEIDVSTDAGSPSVIVGRRRCTTFTTGTCSAETVVNLVSGALAAASGFEKCSKATATTGIDGGTTCSATLQNTSLNAGDWLELVSGTAGGTAKFVAVHILYTTP